jgi:hypothetical protein
MTNAQEQHIAYTIKSVHDYWLARPWLRLGQLMYNVAHTGGWRHADLFNCPDEIITAGLEKSAQENNM